MSVHPQFPISAGYPAILGGLWQNRPSASREYFYISRKTLGCVQNRARITARIEGSGLRKRGPEVNEGAFEQSLERLMRQDLSTGTEAFRERLLAECLDAIAQGDDCVELDDDELEMLAAAGDAAFLSNRGQ